MSTTLPIPLLRLVEALAAEAVEDYLAAQAAPDGSAGVELSNPAPLPAPSKAA